MINSPCDLFISKLADVSSRGEGAWAARCPAHSDETPSLFVVDKTPKGFHLQCAAGCSADAIVEAVGMTRADRLGRIAKKVKLTLETPGVDSTFYDYHDADGELVFQKVRLEREVEGLKIKTFRIRRKVKGSWKWEKGVAKQVPFRLPALLAAPYCLITEGEKAALRLMSEGFVATTLPDGASSKWEATYADHFRGKRVAILPDNDLPGRGYARMLVAELAQVAAEVRVVELPGLREGDDVYDWFARGGTKAELEGHLRAAAPVKADDIPDQFPLTETGNADRFVRHHGDDIRHVAGLKVPWHHWDGVRWREDDTQVELYRRATDVLRRLESEAEAAPDGDEAAAYQRHIRASSKAAGIAAMLSLAARRSEIAVSRSELDDPERTMWYLAAPNGVVDLRTGKVTPARRDLFITRCTAAAFDPDAKAPRWERFLQEIRAGDIKEIAFLQRWLGSGLTGSTQEQKFAIFQGSGSNGKGRLAHTVRKVLGTYAEPADISSFTEVKNRSTVRDDLATLRPARMVVASEPNDGSAIDESVIKQISGEDPISCSHKHERTMKYDPQFKLTLLSNPKPKIRGTNHGIWRRVMFIEFMRTFEVDGDQLASELRAEFPGILRWLVEGCLDWQRNGLGVPETVKQSTIRYRNEQDPLSGFIEDMCQVKDYYRVPEKYLFLAYKKWSEEACEFSFRDIRKFRAVLQERNGIRRYVADGGKPFFSGIGLRPAAYADLDIPKKEREESALQARLATTADGDDSGPF